MLLLSPPLLLSATAKIHLPNVVWSVVAMKRTNNNAKSNHHPHTVPMPIKTRECDGDKYKYTICTPTFFTILETTAQKHHQSSLQPQSHPRYRICFEAYSHTLENPVYSHVDHTSRRVYR